jgi:hypothetical protein
VLDDNTQSGAVIHNVTVLPLVAPAFAGAKAVNARFRVGKSPTAVAAQAPVGTSFTFTLSAPAKVTVVIARSAPGVRRGTRCVAVPRTPRPHARRCTRAVKAGTLTRAHLPDGPGAIAFSGRIGTRALKPGAYTATLSASNAQGRAKPVKVRFRIVA